MSKASETAYQAIRGHIVAGAFGAGAHLKEEELTLLAGVSRTPVREALRRLEAESFVQRLDNGRMVVPAVSEQDIRDRFFLRSLLEGETAALAAERVTAEELAALKAAHGAIDAAVRARPQPDVAGFLAHNRLFHHQLMKAAHSQSLADLLLRLVQQPVVMRTAYSYHRRDLLRSHSEHAELLEALETRNATWARAVMAAHIQRAYQVYLRAVR
jgi:DNA-binding GntR family transcriptional regulator